jgi:competence protein ComEA
VHPAPLAKLAVASRPASHVVVSRAEDLAPGEGREDVLKVCTACHSLGTVTSSGRTRGGWSNVVEEMRGRGAKADDATAKRITEYLAAHFAP